MLLDKPFRSAIIILAILILHYPSCCAKSNHDCATSSCGHIHNISYPFRLKQDPKHCGDFRYELSCENNFTILYLYSGKYYIKALNYNNYTIRVVDAAIERENFSSRPSFSLARFNFTGGDSFSWFKYKWKKSEIYPQLSKPIIFLNCAEPVNSPLYVNTAACNTCSKHSLNNSLLFHPKRYLYVMVGQISAFNFEKWCHIDLMAMTSWPTEEGNSSFQYIHSQLLYGFELSWFQVNCIKCPTHSDCYIDDMDQIHCLHHGPASTINRMISVVKGILWTVFFYLMIHLSAKSLCGTPVVILFLVKKWKRRHFSAYDNIEAYLQSDNNLVPIRYSYSEIREMSRDFKDKLGEGGYGSVYKGTLRSGHLVAIKMLGKAKGNGQDFLNEIATIGRIHHVNLVKLVGFCVEGSKYALVYDFMANGSLDRLIFSRGEHISLTCKQMLEISVGIARGIEYLHRGCNMKILHFDIKPHNILLDENFSPKVSDFGLAKLYPLEVNTVSLTATRGTIGYIAPELFYKNIGGVSNKADVYSFGMLLMEMAGRRRNLNAFAERSSQIYYPSWVYDELNEGNEIEIGNATPEENKIVLKMIIVALWCIQMKPANRPDMSRVVNMLESEVESLAMPPKPTLSLPRMEEQEEEANTDTAELPSSKLSVQPSDCAALLDATN